jgi:DUF4097 and DUF4098 domain-containing protein YvlB
MKMYYQVASLALVAATAFAQQSALTREGSYWVETVSGYVTAPPPVQLKVVARGSVKLEGDGGNQVAYRLAKRVQAGSEAEARRLLAQARFQTRTLGGWVYLEYAAPDNRVVPELTVRTPSQLRRASVETAWGSLHLQGLAAEVDAATGGGPITADQIGGALTVKTGGGVVEIGSVGGILRANTGGGGIRVGRVGGESWLETAGGEIHVDNAGGPVHASTGGGNVEINRAETHVFARTNGGLIAVNESGGEVRAESAAGGIRVSSAKGVRCESAAGAIRLRQVSGELKAATAVGSILAELAATGELLDSILSTTSGDITVWIPSNLAVTVQALNDTIGQRGRIVSDFAEIKVAAGAGANRGRTVASGVLNGGGPTLKLAAAQGTIYLRRR